MNPFKQLAQTLAVTATLLIAQPIQSETFYLHNDHLGTPQAVTDDSGTVVWQGNYSPFGEVTETTDTVEQNIRFPGQYFEEETGLHYNYFRDYDPGTGRYIESDPIGLGGGVNTFGYGYQSPTMNIDPTGEAVPVAVAACLANPLCSAAVFGSGGAAACHASGLCSVPDNGSKPDWWPDDVPHPDDPPAETTESCEVDPKPEVSDSNNEPPSNACGKVASAVRLRCEQAGGSSRYCGAKALSAFIACMAFTSYF